MKRILVVLLLCLAPMHFAYAQPVELYRFTGGLRDHLGFAIACPRQFSSSSVNSDFMFSEFGFNGSGRVQIYRGDGQVQLFSKASGAFAAEYGFALDRLGDINKDGFEDVVIGDPLGTGGIGGFVVEGPTGANFRTFFTTAASNNSRLGHSVAGLFADVNGNGYNDLIAGAPDNFNGGSGRIGYVGVFDGLTGAGILDLFGIMDGDDFGWKVLSTRDRDADSIRDLVVGSPGSNGNSGIVYIYSSKTLGSPLGEYDGVNYLTEPGVGRFGQAIATLPDVDADGREDYLIGAPAAVINDATVGEAFVVSGLAGTKLCTISGAVGGDALGSSVAALGDVDRDGMEDFAVGAPGANVGTGAVYIYSVNGSGVCTRNFTLTGSHQGEFFGISLAGTSSGGLLKCDLNGDMIDDFIVGTDESVPNNSAGSAIAFGGRPPTPTPTISPTPGPTSTPNDTPSSSRFTFKIARDGSFSGVNKMNVDPGENCTVTLYGRRTSSNNENRGRVFTVREKPAEKETFFSAENLKKPKLESAGRPYILHMIVKNKCAGHKAFLSNVFARRLTCGARPALPIDEYEDQIANKVR